MANQAVPVPLLRAVPTRLVVVGGGGGGGVLQLMDEWTDLSAVKGRKPHDLLTPSPHALQEPKRVSSARET